MRHILMMVEHIISDVDATNRMPQQGAIESVTYAADFNLTLSQ